MRLRVFLPLLLLPVISAFSACTDDEVNPVTGATSTTSGSGGAGGGTGGGGGEVPTDTWPNLECDSLVPEVCAYPFPSNVFTIPDSSTPTGRRVAISDTTLPVSFQGYQPSGAPWSKSDGFSAGMSLLAYFAGATMTGMPTPETIEASLDANCPTVILDAETGERMPHWVEIDWSTQAEDQRSFIIRPAVRLSDARRYIVAIRGVVDGAGSPVAVSPAFAALRDGSDLDDPSVSARRELYADIFDKLAAAGVAKDDLQLAWDFTTASQENNTGWMLHMRDQALAAVGDDGPAYTITDVDPAYDPEIAFKIEGTMKVPLYLDQPDPGAHLIFGDDGLPKSTSDYDVPFELLIPQSALTTPAKLLQYGHGLLGSRTQIESGHFLTFMNTYNYAMFAVNLDGIAEDDETWIGGRVGLGEADKLTSMFERMHQGVLNNLMAMRMVSRGMVKDATYGAYLNGDERYYFGISQGGIFGGVYMALSTDVERGALEVMGQPYSLLLYRSVDFEPFFAFLRFALPDARDQQIFLNVTQMAWDRVEPNGYSQHIIKDNLPGTPPHNVLMRAALGDHQVTTWGAHIMARAVGATHMDTGLREIWNLPSQKGPITGSAYVEYDFGLPHEPLCNVPLDLCGDPHGKLRKLDEARVQLDTFLTTGDIVNTCTGGASGDVCDFSDMSECTGSEDPEASCK